MNGPSAPLRAGFVLLTLASSGFGFTREVDLRRDTESAALVVTGTVERVRSYYKEDGDITTEVTLRVEAALKQETETPSSLIFTVPGGEVGEEGVLYTDAPQFQVDEAVIVFLDLTPDGQPQASLKLELDGRALPQLDMRGTEVVEKVTSLLFELGRPPRESEMRRALAFARASANRGPVLSKRSATDGPIILSAGSAACYALIGPKWRIPTVTYKNDATLPAGFAAAVAAAAAPFNSAGIPLRLTMNPFSANLVNYIHISNSSTLAQTRITYQAATSTIMGFTLSYNRNIPWGFAGEVNRFDVQGVGAHEFGHAIGLNHPADPTCNDQTMWFSAAPGEVIKRTLEVGDIAGLMALYGPAPVVVAPPPSAPPPTVAPPSPSGAPPVPVFSGMSLSGTLATSRPITMDITGSSFVTGQVGLQVIIRGAGCPSTGCVIDTRSLQNLSSTTARAIFTPSGGGTFNVRLRNTSTGVVSADSRSFSVAIAVRR